MMQKKVVILSHLSTLASKRPTQAKVAVAVFGSMMLGMVAALAVVPDNLPDSANLKLALRPLDFDSFFNTATYGGAFRHEDRVQKSDTLPTLLRRLGVEDEEATSYLLQSPAVAVISKQMRPGKFVTATTDETGRLLRFVFPLNGKEDVAIVLERDSSGFSAHQEQVAPTVEVALKSGEISSSLFAATDAAGIPDSIALQLTEIFGSQIDFHRDLRKGDRFAITYEIFRHQGQVIRPGRILGAEFINGGRPYRAIFHSHDGVGGYYDAAGRSLRKAFLRSPIEFSRVTSGFSSSRLHPVLKEWRAHKGVDYGAPVGTGVRATADGIVQVIGRQGGYGNLIVLRHQGHYSTAYGHLSRFADGLRAGTRVKQGDTIGYVGQTGLASGPHLHYEFRVNDQQVNPLTAVQPETPPLSGTSLRNFRPVADTASARIEMAYRIAEHQFE